MAVGGRERGALDFGEVGCFGGQEFGAEIAYLVLLVGRAALARLAELELRVRWEEALVVCWSFEVFFSASLRGELASYTLRKYVVVELTGSKVGL